MLRGELGVVLDQVDLNGDVPTDDPSNRNHDTKTSEELVQHFVEVDNRVKSLRASIAKLAEESANTAAEIESRGMSGALSLTRTLREEVKEIDIKIHEASFIIAAYFHCGAARRCAYRKLSAGHAPCKGRKSGFRY